MGVRQLIERGVAVLADSVEIQPAGVIEPHCSRRFIHAFARGVVAGPADNREIRVTVDRHDMAVAARDDKAEERRLKLGVCNVIRRNVRAQMMHRHERNARCV